MRAYLDCEMLKENHKDAGEVISIGIITENNDVYYSLIQTKRPLSISPRLYFLTGISDSMIDTAPTFPKVMSEVNEFLKNVDDVYIFGKADIAALTKTFHINEAIYHFDKETKEKHYEIMSKIKDIHDDILLSQFEKNLSLAELYETILNEKSINSHNALDDARDLKRIHDALKS